MRNYFQKPEANLRYNSTHKRCRICKDFKDNSAFSMDNSTPDALAPICRECDAAKRENHRRNNRLQHLVKGAKTRARRKKVPFALNPKNLVIPKVCPVLGIPLVFGENGKVEDGSPSIDRFVPELGYVPENIAIISTKANTIKSYGTAEEHEKIAAWMRKKELTGITSSGTMSV